MPPAGLAVLVQGVGATARTAAVVAVPLAMVLAVSYWGHDQWGGRATVLARGAWAGRVVLCGVGLAVGLMETGHLLPTLALLVAAAATVTTPPAISWGRRSNRRHDARTRRARADP